MKAAYERAELVYGQDLPYTEAEDVELAQCGEKQARVAVLAGLVRELTEAWLKSCSDVIDHPDDDDLLRRAREAVK